MDEEEPSPIDHIPHLSEHLRSEIYRGQKRRGVARIKLATATGWKLVLGEFKYVGQAGEKNVTDRRRPSDGNQSPPKGRRNALKRATTQSHTRERMGYTTGSENERTDRNRPSSSILFWRSTELNSEKKTGK